MMDANDATPRYEPDIAGVDHSVVTDPLVGEALGKLLTAWRMRKRWDDFPSDHRAVHHAILNGYVQTGDAPRRADLAGITGGDIGAVLEDLRERDLIVLRGGEVDVAYPFTSRNSVHGVEIGTRKIKCVCAIDALGVGAMIDSAVRAYSRCPECDTAIDIRIGDSGLSIEAVQPKGAVVWAGVSATQGCAADTQCRSMLLFCSGAHLQAWREKNAPGGEGFRLTPDQALQAGAAVFRPFMAKTDAQEGNL